MATEEAVRGRNVLIVDDEAIIADTLTRIFLKHGFAARSAGSAEEAADVISTWPPNLAILDVMLPGISGVDFAVALKKIYPHCEVLLFSGQPASAELVEAARKDGHAFEIVAKPVHPELLLQRAMALLRMIDTQPGISPDLTSLEDAPAVPLQIALEKPNGHKP
jgi:DNA-binding response OmpR family regulator